MYVVACAFVKNKSDIERCRNKVIVGSHEPVAAPYRHAIPVKQTAPLAGYTHTERHAAAKQLTRRGAPGFIWWVHAGDAGELRHGRRLYYPAGQTPLLTLVVISIVGTGDCIMSSAQKLWAEFDASQPHNK